MFGDRVGEWGRGSQGRLIEGRVETGARMLRTKVIKTRARAQKPGPAQ